MGLTRLETKEGIFLFDHEFHDRPFTPEAMPHAFDAFVLEPFADVPHNDPRQTRIEERPEGSLLGAVKYAHKEGKDIWVVDVSARQGTRYELNPQSSPLMDYVGAGVFAAMTAADIAMIATNRKTLNRRQFILHGAAATAFAAVGGKLFADAHARAAEIRRVKAAEESLSGARDVGLDDADRLAVKDSRLLRDHPIVDLRDALNAGKTLWVADRLNASLGRKPTLYFVYGIDHTGILDYLREPNRIPEALKRWEKDIPEFLHTEQLDKATLWRPDGRGWRPEVFDCGIPALRRPERMPVESIEGARRQKVRN
jgi:hypothetical protein